MLSGGGVYAQQEAAVEYFLIENLGVKNYSEFITSIDKSAKSKIVYSCIPAGIIGVDKTYSAQFLSKSKSYFKQIEFLEISSEEAELKCSKQRH